MVSVILFAASIYLLVPCHEVRGLAVVSRTLTSATLCLQNESLPPYSDAFASRSHEYLPRLCVVMYNEWKRVAIDLQSSIRLILDCIVMRLPPCCVWVKDLLLPCAVLASHLLVPLQYVSVDVPPRDSSIQASHWQGETCCTFQWRTSRCMSLSMYLVKP